MDVINMHQYIDYSYEFKRRGRKICLQKKTHYTERAYLNIQNIWKRSTENKKKFIQYEKIKKWRSSLIGFRIGVVPKWSSPIFLRCFLKQTYSQVFICQKITQNSRNLKNILFIQASYKKSHSSDHDTSLHSFCVLMHLRDLILMNMISSSPQAQLRARQLLQNPKLSIFATVINRRGIFGVIHMNIKKDWNSEKLGISSLISSCQ